MATFVLVHGGGHGGWCWEMIAPALSSAGHRVFAPDLPSLGDDPTPVEQVTGAMCIKKIVDLIETISEKVVLVGHSIGGGVISSVAELMPEKIMGLVYVTAALVPSGTTVSQEGSDEVAGVLRRVKITEDGLATIIEPDLALDAFYNKTDPALAAAAIKRLRPNALAFREAANQTTDGRWGRIPRSFIECTQDKVLPLRLQRKMQEKFPCKPVFTLDSDHSPFYCCPRELTESLLESVRYFVHAKPG